MQTIPAGRASGQTSWNFLVRMKLWQKFALLGALAVAAVSLPYVRFYETAQEGIDFAKDEIGGLAPTQSLTRILQALQQHRGLSAQVLGLSLDELITIYRVQFPVLRQYEIDTWYDAAGRIVFTASKGLAGNTHSRTR